MRPQRVIIFPVYNPDEAIKRLQQAAWQFGGRVVTNIQWTEIGKTVIDARFFYPKTCPTCGHKEWPQ